VVSAGWEQQRQCLVAEPEITEAIVPESKKNTWRQEQDPIVRKVSVPETFIQLATHTAATFTSFWLVGFEFSVLVGMLLGVALINLNILATSTSSNVHLAEIRDLLARSASG